MDAQKPTKVNLLLRNVPPGTVLLSSWLADKGYSYDLQKRYRKSYWLETIGPGAMIRSGDIVGYEGAVWAMQTQAGLHIHPGGLTAFSLLGKAHYLEMDAQKVSLFGGESERLPAWFLNHDWGLNIDYHSTSFIPAEAELIEVLLGNISIKVSTAVRAMMECLYLTPAAQDIQECFEIMEGLNNLNPSKVQLLLEQCTSIKVKRLFLYLADKAGHEWFRYIDIRNIDLGKGKRSIVKGGTYISKYQITVPKALESDGNEIL